jgi:hypothetical protein
MAPATVAEARDATPPLVVPAVVPATPDGANGWYRGPVSVGFAVSDPDSPVANQTGCGTTTPADGTTTATCAASSAGGTTTVPVTIHRDSTAPVAPAITGIGANQAYVPSAVPVAAAVGCVSSDPTSGIASCTVTGLSADIGQHTLTATAVDGAGMTTTSTLAYTVVAPVALDSVTLASRARQKTFFAGGLAVTLDAPTAGARLAVTAWVALPPARKGKKPRRIALGTVSRTVAAAGPAQLRVAVPSKWARSQLKTHASFKVTLAISGHAAGAPAAAFTRTVTISR